MVHQVHTISYPKYNRNNALHLRIIVMEIQLLEVR